MGGRGRKGLRNLAEELNGVEQRGEGPGRRELGGGGRSAAAAGGRRARRSKSASQTLQQSPELGRRRRSRRRRRTSRPQPARAHCPWPRAAAGHGSPGKEGATRIGGPEPRRPRSAWIVSYCRPQFSGRIILTFGRNTSKRCAAD